MEKIGHGSLGPAFRAKVLPIGGIRVLKCFSGRLAVDEDLMDRFRREIRAASAVRHTNAVHVESLERAADGRPFIVMDYAQGLTLRELLIRGSFIPALDVVEIMGQICAALDRAHGQGIVHQNLKPENVIIAEEQEGIAHVNVMEFGMANLRQAATERGKQVGDVLITDQGPVAGTLEYMSPEQA
ncbi:MAG: protein kinase, partial [Acidobacteria bacterium]|nr:protein kinase [Acidobacteriota bacterium]